MFDRIRRYRSLQTLRNHALPDHLWRKLRRDLYLLHNLSVRQAVRLRERTTLLLHDKAIHGVQGLDMSLEMKAVIGAQALLLALAATVFSKSANRPGERDKAHHFETRR
jgi:Mlc titration factor MtfA (ptsG expression regulator)